MRAIASDLRDRLAVRVDPTYEPADWNATNHGDSIPVEVCIDENAAPGDVVHALARLLIDLARRRLAQQQAGDDQNIPGGPAR